MRHWAYLALIILIGSCSSGRDRAPSTVIDACRMQAEKPHWFRAMRQTEARWGVPVAVQLATISRESSFDQHARPLKRVGSGIFSRQVPRSSAYGFSQAIDGTWEWYVRDTGNRRADRSNFADASDFIGWYMNLNSRLNGVAPGDAYNQYLAYHEGKTGFARGSYRGKAWLPPVARDVQGWAVRYDRQLRLCPGR